MLKPLHQHHCSRSSDWLETELPTMFMVDFFEKEALNASHWRDRESPHPREMNFHTLFACVYSYDLQKKENKAWRRAVWQASTLGGRDGKGCLLQELSSVGQAGAQAVPQPSSNAIPRLLRFGLSSAVSTFHPKPLAVFPYLFPAAKGAETSRL